VSVWESRSAVATVSWWSRAQSATLRMYARDVTRRLRWLSAALVIALGCSVTGQRPVTPALAPYVPTPPDVVERMLSLAQVTKTDVVYDLGSGDGRIVITAAKKYGARAVGIEIDPERVKEARRNARRAGVGRLATFRLEDALTANMADATVVTLYLLSSGNDLLKPALLRLKPGTRVVSHAFGMAGWQPEKVDRFTDAMGDERVLYLWRIPAVQ
jgi:SAM-dependent methyltransferase